GQSHRGCAAPVQSLLLYRHGEFSVFGAVLVLQPRFRLKDCELTRTSSMADRWIDGFTFDCLLLTSSDIRPDRRRCQSAGATHLPRKESVVSYFRGDSNRNYCVRIC